MTTVQCNAGDLLIRPAGQCSASHPYMQTLLPLVDATSNVMSLTLACTKGGDSDRAKTPDPAGIVSATCLMIGCGQKPSLSSKYKTNQVTSTTLFSTTYGSAMTLSCASGTSFEGLSDAALASNKLNPKRAARMKLNCAADGTYDNDIPDACYTNVNAPSNGDVVTSYSSTSAVNVTLTLNCADGYITSDTSGRFVFAASEFLSATPPTFGCSEIPKPSNLQASAGASLYTYPVTWSPPSTNLYVKALSYQMRIHMKFPKSGEVDFTAAQTKGMLYDGQIINLGGDISMSSWTMVMDSNENIEGTVSSFDLRLHNINSTSTSTSAGWVPFANTVTLSCACPGASNAAGNVVINRIYQNFDDANCKY